MSRVELSHSDVYRLCLDLRIRILRSSVGPGNRARRIFGVPRGGVPVAYMLASLGMEAVNSVEEADVVVDDLIDSGRTMMKWEVLSNHKPFLAMIDKRNSEVFANKWIVFPWEKGDEGTGIEDNIVRLLQYVGEDPERGGLLETPKRVAAAWKHWCGGYDTDIPSLLKTFEDGVCDEMVLVKDIPFYTHCEHHLAPFFGTATIGYIPSGKVVGLSKLSRVLDAFARRLQVQERLTVQVASALNEHLQPKGVGVILKARHLCMESRGVRQQGHHTVTSSLTGVMRDFGPARSEFLELAR